MGFAPDAERLAGASLTLERIDGELWHVLLRARDTIVLETKSLEKGMNREEIDLSMPSETRRRAWDVLAKSQAAGVALDAALNAIREAPQGG